jgi:ligand-binding sensor domain-containing protein/signal transduction histidine kinase
MSKGGPLGSVALSLVTAFCLLSPSVTVGQTNRLSMTDEFIPRVYSKEQGLPDEQVRAILQTHDGYLWVATRRGLARFDGLRFTVFDHLKAPGTQFDDCSSLAEGLEDSLWIGTRIGVLQKIGNACTARLGKRFGYPCICPSRFGGCWLGSPDFGFGRIHGAELTDFHRKSGSPASVVFALEEDEKSGLWVGTFSGLLRYDIKSGRLGTVNSGEDFARLPVIGLCRGLNANLWVLFANRQSDGNWYGTKAWLACLKDGVWVRRPKLDRPDITFDLRSTFLMQDRSGNLWLPSNGGGLNRFRNGKFTFCAFSGAPEKDYALCVQEDRKGNLWVGTEHSGLLRLKPRGISTYTTADGLPNDNIWTICEAADGGVWIGTDGGFCQFKDGKFTTFTKKDGLSNNRVRSLAVDRSGTVWIGTGDKLNELHQGKLTQTVFQYRPERTKIRVVLAGREDTLWMGNIDGLHRLQKGTWTTYATTNGLANNDVRALLEDHAGNLWIGTAGGGVQRLRDDKFTTFSITNGLSSNMAWALHEDEDGVLWIGTDHGLNRLQNGQVTVFTKREGLPDDLVNCILEDDFGRLWIGHDHGIYWVKKQELDDVAAGRAKSVHCVSYDEADGLISRETNGQVSNPAGCKTHDGRLWFPTTKGVAIIDPRKVETDALPPLTAVEQVRANGRVIFDTGPRRAEPVNTAGHIQNQPPRSNGVSNSQKPSSADHHLAAGSAHVLEVRYTANTFAAPERTWFKYRMVGLDDHWIDAGTEREAYFTDLPPGHYRFEVVAGNHHGVWQERGATFAFELAPFIYQTWWFYVLCGGAIAGLVAGVVAWRLRELRKIHRLQQQAAITAERARIAKDLHDGLGADLTRLTMLADMASSEPGAGGGEQLRKLSAFSRDAARELKEMIWIANPANDTVDSLVARICQSAEDFLRDARIRCRFELSPSLPQKRLSLDQRRNLLLMAREAVNNIVKHAGASEVCIRASGAGDSLELTIEDNGRGFDPGKVHQDGLGLNSMKRRIENLGGSFSLESRPGVGTRIMIKLKLEQAR